MSSANERNPSLEIEYYTDPLCGWSWAMEPAWRRLRFEYGDKLKWKYRMSGAMPGKDDRHPNLKMTNPDEMHNSWSKVARESRMPMHTDLWKDNPPCTSFPACLAVKTAEAQSALAAENYLRKLRKAFAVDGRDISQVDVQLDVARKLVSERPDLMDYAQFKDELIDKTALLDFENDVEEASQLCFTRFPTLVMKKGDQTKVLAGFHPYSEVVDALREMDPELKPERKLDQEAYEQFWGDAVPEELEELKVESKKERTYADSVA